MNQLIIVAITCIWLLLLVNIILIVAGYIYYIKTERETFEGLEAYPMVSIMVPAHNEGIVIVRTVESLLALNYPKDRYEIIVINDNSTDNSEELLANLQKRYPGRNLHIINTDAVIGGKGKSNALNIGFESCKGEYIAIYDADNTPEKNALLYLVSEIVQNPKLGAVVGKFRTRNKNVNLLTRFINIETLSFQWMAQAGRWQLFKLCTIPGTNFIMRRSIIEAIGGWDVKAIAEDTEISFRIYKMGYLIKFLPQAVTWEQEPQTLKVWFKQRTRWVKGNIYVLIKNIPMLLDSEAKKVRIDILYFLAIYFLLLSSLVLSDMVLIFNVIGLLTVNMASFSTILWLMAFILFIVGTYISLTTEKGEMNLSNIGVIILMYFIYCKMWMVVAIYGFIMYIRDVILKKEVTWYKTERFEM
nr:glycosyltransferase [uncultured Niameybacter sp.]